VFVLCFSVPTLSTSYAYPSSGALEALMNPYILELSSELKDMAFAELKDMAFAMLKDMAFADQGLCKVAFHQ
jgi:hypothetical protein